ncbi:MAG: hypothetical protein H7244_10010 [Herminiimonas sp.]|nr:hypothetical protein [Herminiimonas sp.]
MRQAVGDSSYAADDETEKQLPENERLYPNLMNSRRPIRSHLLAPLHLTLSGTAAFSLKNGFVFDNKNSSAGTCAGIFLAKTPLQSTDIGGVSQAQ